MVEVLVTSSVMILGILCLRKLTMGKISMKIRYALWLLVAVRLLLPVSVAASPFSVMNLLPDSLQGSGQEESYASFPAISAAKPPGGFDGYIFRRMEEAAGKARDEGISGKKPAEPLSGRRTYLHRRTDFVGIAEFVSCAGA